MVRLPSSHAAPWRLASAGLIFHGVLHLKNVMHMSIEIAGQASDGTQLCMSICPDRGYRDDRGCGRERSCSSKGRVGDGPRTSVRPYIDANGVIYMLCLHPHAGSRCETSQAQNPSRSRRNPARGQVDPLCCSALLQMSYQKILPRTTFLHRIFLPLVGPRKMPEWQDLVVNTVMKLLKRAWTFGVASADLTLQTQAIGRGTR